MLWPGLQMTQNFRTNEPATPGRLSESLPRDREVRDEMKSGSWESARTGSEPCEQEREVQTGWHYLRLVRWSDKSDIHECRCMDS